MTDEQGRAPLTDRQRLVYEFIVAYQRKAGYPPTMREIGSHISVGSTNGVDDHLVALEKKGWIRRTSMRSRGIKIVAQPADDGGDPDMEARALRAEERADAAERRAADAERRAREANDRAAQLAAEVSRLQRLVAIRDAAGRRHEK
jgi:SOS-response transcriptional repressor LexA